MKRTTSWLFLALVVVYYVFVVSAGHMGTWPRWSAFADAQAEGFRAGHLYALLPPGSGHWDYSLYGGHWYTYWGLYPAMALAALKTLLRMKSTVGDEALVFLFLVGRLIAGWLLIRAMARRLEPPPPRAAVALALAVFALAGPTPFMLARAAIYESAIAAGSCFLTLGILFAFEGMFAEAPRAANRWLLGASAAFGLAGGSRSMLLPAIALITALTIYARWRVDGGGRRRLVSVALAAGAPVAALTFVHLLLNRLRFDAWLEFGAHHQKGFALQMGARFVPANLFLYLFQRPDPSCHFPWLLPSWNRSRDLAPQLIPFAADYRATEPTWGLLFAAPILWLGVAAAIAVAIERARARRAGAAAPAGASTTPEDRLRGRWVWVCLATGAIGAAIPVLFLFSISMRYEADFATCLLLMAILAGWKLLALPTSRGGQIAARTAFAMLSIATIVLGILPAFVGYFGQFQRHNPTLMGKLSRHLDVCGRH